VFLISFTHGLVGSLEVLNLSHLRKMGTAGYGALNSFFAFLLIYIVVVDETSRFMLVVPWVIGDVLAGQVGISWFGRKQ
jgi:hypothetical protein